MRFEGLEKVALALGQEHSLEVLFKRIADELVRYRDVALARLWMVGPASQCELCRGNVNADKDRPSLHLRASAGGPLAGDEDWSRLDADDYHFGGVKEQQICAMGNAMLITELDRYPERLRWVRREQIRSFAGHPLIFGGECLGVIAVFTRTLMDDADFEWLRVFSIAMAAAIANARAFEETHDLRQQQASGTTHQSEQASATADDYAILGSSPAIRRVLEQIEMVAPTDVAVLILGETGVGKELVARAIHERSPRRHHALVSVNCTAIPLELFESIFFGHVMGAFSGATANRVGRFQTADRGSLFLDEIGDLPAHVQPKLLRVLQDGKFEPVGSEKTQHADVRIIAASNRDLKKALAEHRFREDLFYRLNVFPIAVPPLRERKDDILTLAGHFVELACRRFSRPSMQLTAGHLRQLQEYDWPGNVRELQNVIERAVIAARGGSLHFDIGQDGPVVAGRLAHHAADGTPEASEILTEDQMKRRERDNIAAALKLSEGRVYGPGGAAEMLGIKPTTLNARIKKWGIGKLP
jgi:transcriptional regulator with GAF, ATPase, and Fis domain